MAFKSPYTTHHLHPVGKSCLEKHPDDSHHGQTAVCQLCIKLGFLHLWVIRCDELPSKVSSKGCGSRGLVLGNFAEGHVCRDLSPACCWHFGDCCKSIGNICKLQAGRWRQEAREFPSKFWGDVSHGCKHRNSAMLDFCGTTALEVLNAAIAGKPCWVPKTHWSLHTEFILKGTQRRGSVVGPVAPSTASQSILFSRDRRFKKPFEDVWWVLCLQDMNLSKNIWYVSFEASRGLHQIWWSCLTWNLSSYMASSWIISCTILSWNNRKEKQEVIIIYLDCISISIILFMYIQ